MQLYRAVLADTPPPAFPSGAALTTEAGATGHRRWPAAERAADYVLSVDGVARPATTTRSALLTGLTPGSTVALTLVARDARSRASSPLRATVTLPGGATRGSAPLSATAGPGARVALQWAAAPVAGLTGYRVLRGGTALAERRRRHDLVRGPHRPGRDRPDLRGRPAARHPAGAADPGRHRAHPPRSA